MNPYYPHLFEPLTIKGITFRNRLFVAPHMMSHMDFNGRPDESMIDFYAEKARGGFAVVTLGDTPVDREHAATNPRSFAVTPENQPKLAEIARAIHAGGALASQELNHGGKWPSPGPTGTRTPTAGRPGARWRSTGWSPACSTASPMRSASTSTA